MEAFSKRNKELFKRLNDGDKSARDLLCGENMGLVKRIASGFSKNGVQDEDLIQTGAIGLIKAIDNFDISLGVQFSTYAVPVILGEIRRFLRDDGLIKVSRTLKQAAQKGMKAREELKSKTGREPTIKDISEFTGLSCEDLVCAFDAIKEPDSINQAIFYDSDETMEDTLTIGNEEEKITDRILIEQLLDKIEPKERQVIVLRYFKDKSQREIADLLDISQVQVSRIEKRVIEKLRLTKV